ncbi:recombinase family protein [Kordiimonas aquimaris]|uniref:recombinase family protein n=1 Tax=Kordiimonas aquimaris TaxID=707591 RepID=UPI0021D1569C|nr:recombinase family protein [Kordiimonas aquimaris]
MEIYSDIESAISQWLSENDHPKEPEKCPLSVNDRQCNSEIAVMDLFPQINAPGRKVGYARVSTKDQKLRMQLEGLKAIGCKPIFKDHGISGAKGKRPGLDDALKFLKPGDSLVVFKLDRLGRSVLHLSDLLTRFNNEGIHFCSMSEGINTTTPSGKMVYHILSAVAEFHRDIIIENTLAGLEAAKASGKRLGPKYKLDIETIAHAHESVMQRGESISAVARRYRVSRSTITRGFERLERQVY